MYCIDAELEIFYIGHYVIKLLTVIRLLGINYIIGRNNNPVELLTSVSVFFATHGAI